LQESVDHLEIPGRFDFIASTMLQLAFACQVGADSGDMKNRQEYEENHKPNQLDDNA
jgi:hypothetical protein